VEQNNSNNQNNSNIPQHVALLTMGKSEWAKKNNVSIQEAYKKSFDNLKYFIANSVSLNIPITSFHLFTIKAKELNQFSDIMDLLVEHFESLANDPIIHDNEVKLNIIGKWYDLPGAVIEAVKKMIDKTKDYNKFHVNLGVNYDGQEEIIDAIKMIGRQIKAEKIDVEAIDKQLVKDNIYGSYEIPPQLLITNHRSKNTAGLLLWDSSRTHIYHSPKLWPDFDIQDLKAAIEDYQKYK